MSYVICEVCDAPINSDDDPDCFIEPDRSIPPGRLPTMIICEPCRERAWERENERAMEEG